MIIYLKHSGYNAFEACGAPGGYYLNYKIAVEKLATFFSPGQAEY